MTTGHAVLGQAARRSESIDRHRGALLTSVSSRTQQTERRVPPHGRTCSWFWTKVLAVETVRVADHHCVSTVEWETVAWLIGLTATD
jgi:hypothetical protein